MAIVPIGGVERKSRPAKVRKDNASLLASEMQSATAEPVADEPPPPFAAPTPLIAPATALAAQEELDSSGGRSQKRHNPDDDIPEDWRR